eukprot:gene8108-biopygen10618
MAPRGDPMEPNETPSNPGSDAHPWELGPTQKRQKQRGIEVERPPDLSRDCHSHSRRIPMKQMKVWRHSSPQRCHLPFRRRLSRGFHNILRIAGLGGSGRGEAVGR